MSIEIRISKEEEFQQLEQIEAASFDVNAKYFENGQLPLFPEDDKDDYSFKTMWNDENTEVLTILIDAEIAGGAAVKDISADKKEVVLFFLSPDVQGKSYGQKALKMIEDSYPAVKTWRLVTPTQIIRNAVFYVNKCGYSIVYVNEWDKEKECGIFVFEKNVGEKQND